MKIANLMMTAAAGALLLAVPSAAQEAEDVPAVFPGGHSYSPYPEQNFPNRVYFGDTHVHTTYSADAGMIGNTLGPEEAYRFARGETVTSSTGLPAKLARPLDFLVVADHAENIGMAPLLAAKDPELLATELGGKLSAAVEAGDLPGAFRMWSDSKNSGKDALASNPKIYENAWKTITAAAEKYNEPGLFTAFIGYEWTSGLAGTTCTATSSFATARTRPTQIIPFSNFELVRSGRSVEVDGEL